MHCYHDFQDVFKYMVIEQLQGYKVVEQNSFIGRNINISNEQLFTIKQRKGHFFLKLRSKLIKNLQKDSNVVVYFPACYFFKTQKDFQHIQQQQRSQLKLSHKLRQVNQTDQKRKQQINHILQYNSYTKQGILELAERPSVQKLLKYNISIQKSFDNVYLEIIDYQSQLNQIIISEPVTLCFHQGLQKIIYISAKNLFLEVDKDIIQTKLNLQPQKTSLILFWSMIIFLSQDEQQPIFINSIQESCRNFEEEYIFQLKNQSIKLLTLILTLNQIENLNLNTQNLYAFSKIFKTRYELMSKNFYQFSKIYYSDQFNKSIQKKPFLNKKNMLQFEQNFCSQDGIKLMRNFIFPSQFCYLLNQKSKKIIFNDKYFINQSKELFNYQKKEQKKQKAILNNIKDDLFLKIPTTIVLKQYYNDHIFQNINKIRKQNNILFFSSYQSNLFQSVIEQTISQSYKTQQEQVVSFQQLQQMCIYVFLQRNKFFNNKIYGNNFKTEFVSKMSQVKFTSESLIFLEFLDLQLFDRKVFLSAQDDFAYCNYKFFKQKKSVFSTENYYQYISDLLNEDLLILNMLASKKCSGKNIQNMIWNAQMNNYLKSKTYFQQNHQQVLTEIFLKCNDGTKKNFKLWEQLANKVLENIDSLFFFYLIGSFQEFNGLALFSEEVRTLRLTSFIEEIKKTTNSFIQSTLTNLITQQKMDPLKYQKQIYQTLPFKKLLSPKTLSLLNEFLILVMIFPICKTNFLNSEKQIIKRINLLKEALTSQGSFLFVRTLNFIQSAKKVLKDLDFGNTNNKARILQLLKQSLHIGNQINDVFTQINDKQLQSFYYFQQILLYINQLYKASSFSLYLFVNFIL